MVHLVDDDGKNDDDDGGGGGDDEGRAEDFSLGARSKVKSRGGVLGEGQQPPPHQLGGLGERCDLTQWSSGQSPDLPKVFHYFQHSVWIS